MIAGTGTLVNVATVLVGSSLGVVVGHRLPERTRDVVTDALGLTTLLIAILSALAVTDPALVAAVGTSAPMLIVLGSLLVGGIVGSLMRLEQRVESLGGWLQTRLTRILLDEKSGSPRRCSAEERSGGDEERRGVTQRRRFIEGFVAASLLFCTGPLTVLGSLSDGLGRGADQLYLKAVLDGFAALAFASSFGWGVAASALTVIVIQGGLTLVGLFLGDVLSDAQVAALGATGGLLLVGIALRLLRIREVPVADLLPALIVAPILVSAAHLWV